MYKWNAAMRATRLQKTQSKWSGCFWNSHKSGGYIRVLSHFSKRNLEFITNNQIFIVIINTRSHNLPITKNPSQSKRESSHRHQSTRQRSTSHHNRSLSLASRAARKTRSSRLS